MKSKITSLIIFIFAIQFCIAQTSPTLPSGWERIYIKNTGSFDIPPSMEVQKGKYRKFIDEIKKIQGFDASEITAQQKGLNEFSKTGYERYARVMLETKYDSPDEFEELNFNIFNYSKAYINELNSIYKDQMLQDLSGTNLKLIEWYPLKFERVNGMSCIHVSYLRQLNSNPKVLVHMYIFQNYERVHTLTLSYRISEASYWESDFSTILNSFRITTKRQEK